jgi:NitT/TauT family transport system permease protein
MAFRKAEVNLSARQGDIVLSPRENGIRTWASNNLKFLVLFSILICIYLNVLFPGKPASAVREYQHVLIFSLGIFALVLAASYIFKPINVRFNYYSPFLTAVIIFIGLWDLFTTKTGIISTQYVLTPEQIINSAFTSWKTILLGTLYSLKLLGLGFSIGALAGVTTGIAIGWSQRAHYWIKPLVNVVGPIPVAAYTPIAIMAFPTTFWTGVCLIAITTWFPVTVMTNSGISNVLKSYYEVAKTLGADTKYMIIKVAVPAALPSIFTGLFLGLLAAFITLSVAEEAGIKQGLGWYVGHGMIGSYVMIIVLFSGSLSLLFKIRDRVLFWQKGLIKW